MDAKTCAEIDLTRLAGNFSRIQQHVQPANPIAVVKADAYGHGAVPVARCLTSNGCGFFAVARFEEAMALRDSGIDQPILVFGRIFPANLHQAIDAGLRISVFGREDVRWIEGAAGSRPAYVHLNVESGMGRMGVFPDQQPDIFNVLKDNPSVLWEGLYSHFATSDEKDKSYAHTQMERFAQVVAQVKSVFLPDQNPPMIHMANSGAILDLPTSWYDAVRPGISLYGCYPSSETSQAVELQQVMCLKSVVAHIRNIPAGHSVSYGRRWIAKCETRIAVLPIGYADGIRRHLTNQMEVLIREQFFPVVGTVTMDHIMVDIADAPVCVGDEVVIWGDSGHAHLSVLDVAERIGTIPYELTCGVTKRVPRIYK